MDPTTNGRRGQVELHVRRRRRNDVDDEGIGRRHNERLRSFNMNDGHVITKDLQRHDARVGDVHVRCARQSDRHGRKWYADVALYDGGNPIMDFNGSGSLTTRYLWGPTGIVARQTSVGVVSWYLADALGTVRDLINNSGAIIDHVDFSAFGTVLGESSASSGDRFVGLAMLERDSVTGLNLPVEREDNPGTGR